VDTTDLSGGPLVGDHRDRLPAYALTQDELVAKIQAAGYSQVSDIKSTAEGITAKAMKDGKEVRLVVDSSGQIKEQK